MSPETSEVIRDAMEGKGEALKQESGMDLVVNGQSIGIGAKPVQARLTILSAVTAVITISG